MKREAVQENSLWLTVKKDIETKIMIGEYVVGAKIPTIVELAEHYNIGKTTAHKVINSLYDEGVIMKQVGKGCFVKPFVREKLLRKHKEEFEACINDTIAEALLLGLEKEYVLKVISDKLNEKM